MVKAKEDLTNKRFDRLTVIQQSEDYITPGGMIISQWLCRCDCGNEIIIRGSSLTRSKNATKSCGCLQKEIVSQYTKKYNTYDLTGEYGIGYTSTGEEFYFDLEDYNLIKDYCWYIDNDGYLRTNLYDGHNKRKVILMHSLIMNTIDNPLNMPDHIHGKNTRHDNRKSNLRIANKTQNNINQQIILQTLKVSLELFYPLLLHYRYVFFSSFPI